MIDKVLGFIVERLNTALQDQDPRSELPAIMGRLGGADSAWFENKIIVSLANIERETATQQANNLFILVAANFNDKNYAEALKSLSAALAFFQSSPVMTPATSPGLPAGIDKLTIEFVTMSFQEVNNLWAVRGSLYLPSFLLKLRTITSATDESASP
jgi:hypothetical protein